MKNPLRSIAVLAAAGALSACGMHGPTSALPAPLSNDAGQVQITRTIPVASGSYRHVCDDRGPGFMHCDSLVRTDVAQSLAIHPMTIPGYGPSDLQTAYGLTAASSADGGGQTIAIVDAFKDSTAAPDLKVYRSAFGLPACTQSSGCLTIHAFGSAGDFGWAQEESLDLDMVSAICPKCHILLVEALNNSTGSLIVAEKYAAARANAVSNSWGGSESTPNTGNDNAFKSSTVAFTASTGDSGYNVPAQWPAILPTVLGVGGTSLTSISPRTESAWDGAGSGCSIEYAKPAFQTGITTGCSKRAEADVSAVADPNTGVAVYDTFEGAGGWGVFGGTSVSSPLVASIFGLVANSSTNNPSYVYAHVATHLHDVKTGSNGSCGAPLCVAGVGWDGPTGLGTPHGTGAF